MVLPTWSLADMHGKATKPLIPFEYTLKHVRTHSRGEKVGVSF
ncbi:hypothetical protein FB379_14011 [Aeribacillus composti]|nr:hypothetical protein FB379_14011 [Aeribacillus composti]